MFCTSVKVLFAGSNIDDFWIPVNAGVYTIVPPLMNARPSGKTSMPLQNMSHDTVNGVIAPLAGSTRIAPDPFDGPYGGPCGHPDTEGRQFPDPVTTRIFPLCSSASWMGLMVS